MHNIRLKKNLLVFYLALGPINWLPYVAAQTMNIIKYSLFVFLLIAALNSKKANSVARLNLNFFLFFAFMMLPAIFQGSQNVIFNILDIVFIFLSAFIVGRYDLNMIDLFGCFRRSVIFIGIAAFLSVILPLIGLNITSPEPWNAPLDIGGFGGYRTGWSNSIFLFIPFAIFSFNKSSDLVHKIIMAVLIIFIMISQLNSGGRAGLLASVLSCVFLFRNNRIILSSFIGLLFVVYFSLGSAYFERKFRYADDIIAVKAGTSDLDKISSGRTSEYDAAIKVIAKSPLWGYGFNNTERILFPFGIKEEVHNTFLKRLIEGGIIFLIPIIALFFFLFRAGFQNKLMWRDKSMRNLFVCYFVFGLMVSLFEPNYLIGSFQGESFFWFVMLSLANDKSFKAIVSRLLPRVHKQIKLTLAVK